MPRTRNAKEDAVVLKYFDWVIKLSDLLTLKGKGWLDDTIIGFYFTFLEKEQYANNNFLFIGPDVTQCLKESPPSDVAIFLDPLEAKKKSFLFFAVNDSSKSAVGSHWSLLVFCCLNNRFFHIDSSSPSNKKSAFKLASNVGVYFSSSSDIEFNELISLQQHNSYDCGIFLICNLENLVEHISNGESDMENVPLINKDVVKRRRSYLEELVLDCGKK